MSEHATWVYAVTRDLGPGVLSEVAGIAGEPVRTVAGDSLTAVIGSVDAEQFGEEAFERRLADPAELAAIARAHHQVVEVVAAAAPALPLRLATVYHDDERVRELLAQRQADFAATLDWLAGRTECGVKVWADLPSAEDGRPEPGPAEPGRGAGAAYLSRRRAQLAARADSRQEAADRGADIHAALCALAVAARMHQPHDVQAPSEGLMVLNGAYLIESGSLARFAESARAAVRDRPGFRLEVTGPWPPYSFAGGPEG
jgi:hypothetical protein